MYIIREKTFQNVVPIMSAILLRPRYINTVIFFILNLIYINIHSPDKKTCYPWISAWGTHAVIGYHGVGNLVILEWKRECGQLCQNIFRKPSWFCRKHIWGQKSSIPVLTWQCSANTARRTVAWLQQQDISTNQGPSQTPHLNAIENV